MRGCWDLGGFPSCHQLVFQFEMCAARPSLPRVVLGPPAPPSYSRKVFSPFYLSQGFSAQPLLCPRIPCSAHSTLLRCKTPRQDVLIKGVCLKCRITAAHSVFSGMMLQRDKGTPKKPPLWKSWGKVMRAVSEQALGGKLD